MHIGHRFNASAVNQPWCHHSTSAHAGKFLFSMRKNQKHSCNHVFVGVRCRVYHGKKVPLVPNVKFNWLWVSGALILVVYKLTYPFVFLLFLVFHCFGLQNLQYTLKQSCSSEITINPHNQSTKPIHKITHKINPHNQRTLSTSLILNISIPLHNGLLHQ